MTTTIKQYIYTEQEYVRYLVQSTDLAASYCVIEEQDGVNWYEIGRNDYTNKSGIMTSNVIDIVPRQTNTRARTYNSSDVLIETSIEYATISEKAIWTSRILPPYRNVLYKSSLVETAAIIDIPNCSITTSELTGTHSCYIDSVVFEIDDLVNPVVEKNLLSAVADADSTTNKRITRLNAETLAMPESLYKIRAHITFINKVTGLTKVYTTDYSHINLVNMQVRGPADNTLSTAKFEYSSDEAVLKITNTPDGLSNYDEAVCFAINFTNNAWVSGTDTWRLDMLGSYPPDGFIDLSTFVQVPAAARGSLEIYATKADLKALLDLPSGQPYDSVYPYEVVFVVMGLKFGDEIELFHNIIPLFWRKDLDDFVGFSSGVEQPGNLYYANSKKRLGGEETVGITIFDPSQYLNFASLPGGASLSPARYRLRYIRGGGGNKQDSFSPFTMYKYDNFNADLYIATGLYFYCMIAEFDETGLGDWVPFSSFFVFDVNMEDVLTWGNKLRTGIYSSSQNSFYQITPLSIFDIKNWTTGFDTERRATDRLAWTKMATPLTAVLDGTDYRISEIFLPYQFNLVEYENRDFDLNGLFVEQDDSAPISVNNRHAFFNLNTFSNTTRKMFKAGLSDIVLPYICVPEEELIRIGDPDYLGTDAYASDLGEIESAMVEDGLVYNMNSRFFLDILYNTNGKLDDLDSIAQPYITPIGVGRTGVVHVGTENFAESIEPPVIALGNLEDEYVRVIYYGTEPIELEYTGFVIPNIMNEAIVGEMIVGESRISSFNTILPTTSQSDARFSFGSIQVTPILIDRYGNDNVTGAAQGIFNENIEDPTDIDFVQFYADGVTIIYAWDNSGHRSHISLKIDSVEVATSETGYISYAVSIPYGQIKTAALTLTDEGGTLVFGKSFALFSKYLIEVDSGDMSSQTIIDGRNIELTMNMDLRLVKTDEIVTITSDAVEFFKYTVGVGWEKLTYVEDGGVFKIDLGPDAYNNLKTNSIRIAPEISGNYILETVTKGHIIDSLTDITPPKVYINIPDKIGLPPEGVLASIYLPVGFYIGESWNATFVEAKMSVYKVVDNVIVNTIEPEYTVLPPGGAIRSLYISELLTFVRDDLIHAGDVVDYILIKIEVVIEGGGSQTWIILSGVCDEVPT